MADVPGGLQSMGLQRVGQTEQRSLHRKGEVGRAVGLWTGFDLQGSGPVRLLWTSWQDLAPHQHDKVHAAQSRLQ